MHDYRGWFYANCTVPNCLNKVLPEEDTFVCADHVMKEAPTFMYYLNTVITDDTGSIEASFFNDSLTHLIGYTCNQMMIEKKNRNPKEIPPVIKSLTGIQLLLTVNIKPNGSLGVDSAQKTSTITPTTPDSKTNTSTRNQPESIGKNKKQKTGEAKARKLLQHA
ncbi:hypothetical protein QVD17_19030 [Tagetes erecta]|nr:hypothetical protein QVD17_19030 [Tagetes erecta]